ncbi:hypothetical protein F5Y12DRAFT_150616 [Xylaria sp. FL1777]|nr:hypothetical protein F5Y12DRAFT_150616 [Xylaria sp. FL1777]
MKNETHQERMNIIAYAFRYLVGQTTSQRISHPIMSNSALLACTSCLEVKPIRDFPDGKLTPHCTHPPTICLECVATFLETQSLNGLMGRLSCPECSELLTYDRIQDLARTEMFERYKKYSIDQLITKLNNFVWCPLGCGTGMVQSIGAQHEITLCLTCNRQFCSRHQMPWHVDYTCDEYDEFLINPRFLSRAQINASSQEKHISQDERLTQLIKEAEDLFAQSLMNEKQASEARLQAEIERKERERQLAEEARRRREQEEARRLLERKRREEDLTNGRFRTLTRPCPQCRVPIEKNRGW